MNFRKWDNAENYAAQTGILTQALATEDHSLDELVRLMRATKQGSVYLAGMRLDNDHCLGSGDIGWSLSVLPEDADKASVPGYHPGSTEVYVTFQGNLVMEFLEDGRVQERRLGPFDTFTMPPGLCHHVRPDSKTAATSLIVKTNLHHKPGVIRCDNCTYYSDPTACPLHRSWRASAS